MRLWHLWHTHSPQIHHGRRVCEAVVEKQARWTRVQTPTPLQRQSSLRDHGLSPVLIRFLGEGQRKVTAALLPLAEATPEERARLVLWNGAKGGLGKGGSARLQQRRCPHRQCPAGTVRARRARTCGAPQARVPDPPPRQEISGRASAPSSAPRSAAGGSWRGSRPGPRPAASSTPGCVRALAPGGGSAEQRTAEAGGRAGVQ